MSGSMTVQDLNSLEPLDSEWVRNRLTQYPFVQIDGVTNVRTLGFYKARPYLHERKDDLTEFKTRPKQLFRSAEVSGITSLGE
jgi:hypothetical protein